MNENNIAFIKEISSHEIFVKSKNKKMRKFLREIGGKKRIFRDFYGWEHWKFNYEIENKQQLAALLMSLIKAGVLVLDVEPFATPPSVIYEFLREKGLIQGKYKKVVWIAQGKVQVTEG